MATDGGMAFWAFVHYLQNNPLKTHYTSDDIEALALRFYATNSSIINQSRPAVGSAFTNADYPKKDDSDGAGVAAFRNTVTIDQAEYPESHRGS